ncbi:hypothetical protein TrVGV298_005236 [Trichoderma virens]|nr:hypothetical protein TrVGV298_005236 [Trichoderma virens]
MEAISEIILASYLISTGSSLYRIAAKPSFILEDPTRPVNLSPVSPSSSHSLFELELFSPHSISGRSRSSSDTSSSSSSSSSIDVPRLSRWDHRQSLWPSGFESLRRLVVGAVNCPALPPASFTMSLRRQSARVPQTPRIISPSPTPSERDVQDYVGPMTRSRRKAPTQQAVEEEQSDDNSSSSGPRRSRTRSRSPLESRVPRMTKTPTASSKTDQDGIMATATATATRLATTNGHLAPPQPAITGWSWRDFSRSPSPLGLIPIHRHWRTFVHKHEVPRKALHVSIGFFVVWLYSSGTQTSAVPPYLMAALVPITTVDWLRHRYASFNRLYVKVLGALMRESEYAGWNGVIFYLLGAWITLYFFPKDVGVISVLLLSWCDTAASTFGRLWGRYTPRLRRGKSLAGSLAAFLVGVATSYLWYGWLVPTIGPMPGDENFMFTGTLSLPQALTEAVGIPDNMASVSGSVALGIMSVWSGFVASASEVADLFGWDDNLTIPVLSGIGIWGFLKLFG